MKKSIICLVIPAILFGTVLSLHCKKVLAPGYLEISGRVTDQKIGAPISGAHIRIFKLGWNSAKYGAGAPPLLGGGKEIVHSITDKNGNYRIVFRDRLADYVFEIYVNNAINNGDTVICKSQLKFSDRRAVVDASFLVPVPLTMLDFKFKNSTGRYDYVKTTLPYKYNGKDYILGYAKAYHCEGEVFPDRTYEIKMTRYIKYNSTIGDDSIFYVTCPLGKITDVDIEY